MKGLTPKEIKAELDGVHGTSAPVFATVYNWVNKFKRGGTSTKDEHRSGLRVPRLLSEIHHYTSETKEQSKQWAFEGERTPKKAKTMRLVGKVMAMEFWMHAESSTPITWKKEKR